MTTQEKIWTLEQQTEQVLAAAKEVQRTLDLVQDEHTRRSKENATSLAAVTRFESLKAQLLKQEVSIAQEALIAEQAAQEEQTKASDELKQSMKELQGRIDAIPPKREEVETRLYNTREELIALHKAILDDQPSIEKNIEMIESFKGAAKVKSSRSSEKDKDEGEDDGGGEAGKDAGADTSEEEGEKSATIIEKEAEELGLTVEELETFHFANEEFESMGEQLHQKELVTKEKLFAASKASEGVQEELAERANEMETVTTSIGKLSTQVKALELNIAKMETRHANLMSKNNDEELRAALDESKKYDRLLEALTAKAKLTTPEPPQSTATPAVL